MTPAYAIDWFRETLWASVIVSAPAIVAIVVVGLIIAVLQAATSISDQAVAFGPKALAALGAMVLSSTWILSRLSRFMVDVIEAMAHIPR